MKTETERAPQTPEAVLNELRALVDEAEQMLGQSPQESCGCDTRLDALRERLEVAQERIAGAYAGAKRTIMAGAKRTDTTIRENPYQSLAVALGIGLLAGVLVGRRWNSAPK